MILEYVEPFEKTVLYNYVSGKLVRNFEDYLMENSIKLEDAYENIYDFVDTLDVVSRTRKNYRTRLRRFVEYIYIQEGIKW